MATALPKVSSTLAQAGNSSAEAIGLLTAGTELIPHQASRVARGLRSITLNLQKMGSESKKSNEFTAKMQEEFDRLGIKLKNSDGQLKSTYQILGELSEQWGDLDSNTKNYFAALIGGKTQVDVVNAVLSNFETAVNATAAAENSAGSAMKENEVVLASIEGKLNQLRSAWELLAYQLIKQDWIKGILDVGTAILHGLASPIGQTLIKLTLFVAAMTLVSKAFTGLGSAVKGLKALDALKTIFFGSAAAIDKETAATNRNTAAKVKNAAASKAQGATVASTAKVTKASAGLQTTAYSLGNGKMPKQLGAVSTSAAKTTGVLSKLGKVASGAFALFKPLPFILVTAAVYGLYKAYKKLSPTVSELGDQIEESQSKLQELETEYNTLIDKKKLTKGEQARLDALDEEIAKTKELIELTEKKQGQTASEKDASNTSIGAGTSQIGETITDNELALARYAEALTKVDTLESEIKQKKRVRDKLTSDHTKKNIDSEIKDLEKQSEKQKKELSKQEKNYEDTVEELKSLYHEYADVFADNPDLLGEQSKEFQKNYAELENWYKKQKKVSDDGIDGWRAYKASAKEALEAAEIGHGNTWVNRASAILLEVDKTDEGIKKGSKQIEDYQQLLKKSDKSTKDFAKQINTLGKSFDDIKVDKADGKAIFDPTRIKEYADQLGYTEEAYRALLERRAKFGEVKFELGEESIKNIQSELGKLDNTLMASDGTIRQSEASFREWAKSAGYGENQIKDMIATLNESGNSIIDFGEKGKEARKSYMDFAKELEGVTTKSKSGDFDIINVDNLVEGLTALNATKEEISNVFSQLSKSDKVKFAGGAEAFDEYNISADKATKKTQKAIDKKNEATKKTDKIKLETEVDDSRLLKADKNIDKTKKKAKDGVTVAIKAEEEGGITGGFDAIFQKIADKAQQGEEVNIEVNGAEDLINVEALLRELPPTTNVAIEIDGQEQVVSASEAIEVIQNQNGTTSAMFITVEGTKETQEAAKASKDLEKNSGFTKNNKVNTSAPGLSTVLSDAKAFSQLQDKTVTNTVITKTKEIKENADGKKKGAEGGLSWVGEEGPELIVSKNSAYLAGQNGWELTTLDRDDIVYTAEETKQILSGVKDIGIPSEEIPRYAKGRKYLNPNKTKKGKQTKQAKKDQKKANKYDNWLSTLQFKLDTDQISEETYMKRLKKRIAKNKSTTKEQYRAAKKELHNYQKEVVKTKAAEYTKRAEYNAKGFTNGLAYLKKAKKQRKISAAEYKEMLNELYQSKLTYDFKQFESGKKSYASLKKQLDAYVKSGKISYSQYYQYIEQLAESAKNKEIDRLTGIQQAEDAKKQLLEMYVEDNITAIDKQIEALEKQNEVQKMGNDLAEKEAALAKAKNQRVKVYREGVGFIYERDTAAIKEAQEALKDAELEKQVSDLEKLKEEWQELQDYIDNWNRAQDQLNLEQQAGITLDQLVAGIGNNLELFSSLYSQIGANSEAYLDLIALLEKATTVEEINKLLDDGKISSNVLYSWLRYNTHDWELDPRRGTGGIKDQNIFTVPWTGGFQVISDAFSDAITSTGGNVAGVVIEDLSVTLPDVTDAQGLVSGIETLANQVVQDAARRT